VGRESTRRANGECPKQTGKRQGEEGARTDDFRQSLYLGSKEGNYFESKKNGGGGWKGQRGAMKGIEDT